MKALFYCFMFLLMVITGCSPIYYSPNTQNVPLLTDTNNLVVHAGGNADRLEIQAAYAVSDHLGVMLNGGFFIPRKEDNGDGGEGQFVEVGTGYFTKLGNNFVWETYGLLGFGHVRNNFPSTLQTFPNTTGMIDANILRYGVQPALGYKRKYFEAAFSTRIVGLNYSSITGSMMYDDIDQNIYLKDNRNHFLIEPAITLRAGIEPIKFQLQIGNSFNITDPDFRQDQGYATIGLILRPRVRSTAKPPIPPQPAPVIIDQPSLQ